MIKNGNFREVIGIQKRKIGKNEIKAVRDIIVISSILGVLSVRSPSSYISKIKLSIISRIIYTYICMYQNMLIKIILV
jgi:hypothetical protein